VAEYLVRWCSSLCRTDTWEQEIKLLPSAKAMVDEFQQQRAQLRKERKQRLPCGVPCEPQPGKEMAAAPAPPATHTGDPVAESAPPPPAAAVTPFSSLSSSPPAARPALPVDDIRPNPSELDGPTQSQQVQRTAADRAAASLSPTDVAALSEVNDGWFDRFVALFSSRLSQRHMAKLLRCIRPLADGRGADFGTTVGTFLAGRPVQLYSDVPGLRHELAESRGGVCKRADQGKGGWPVTHPLMKLAEFQVCATSARRFGGWRKCEVGGGASANTSRTSTARSQPGRGLEMGRLRMGRLGEDGYWACGLGLGRRLKRGMGTLTNMARGPR
jgi:hypothetical protein